MRHRFRAGLFIVAISLAVPEQLHGETIVSFTGNATGGTTAFSNLSSTWVSGTYAVTYSDANQVFGGNVASGLPALSGGVFATKSGSAVNPHAVLVQSTSPDEMQVGFPGNTTFRYMLMAMKAGWITLQSGARFDSTSSLSVFVPGTNQTIIQSVNFVVKDSGQYFMSSSRLTSVQSTLAITNPNIANWTAFVPTAANFGDINPTSLTGSPYAFNNIEAVGLFVQGEVRLPDSMAGYIRVNNWQVTAVPEPSSITISLTGLVVVGSLCLRQRLQRCAVQPATPSPPSTPPTGS
jgi:hypothetical protein